MVARRRDTLQRLVMDSVELTQHGLQLLDSIVLRV